MRKNCIILLVLFGFLIIPCAYAQRNSIKPKWMSELPKTTNSTFDYKVLRIDAKSISEARGLVLREITNYLETTKHVEIMSVSKDAFSNSNGNASEETSFSIMAKVEGEPVSVVAKIIDEYSESGKFGEIYYFLLAVGNPKSKNVSFDRVQVTSMYGAKGFWRSAVCPGWGQMYKGSKTKGVVILGAELVSIGGIVAAESMRASYVTKMHEQPRYAQIYAGKAKNCGNVRNGFIVAAAAVYVYGLVDAISAPGARWIKPSSNSSGGLSFCPVWDENGFSGISLAYSF